MQRKQREQRFFGVVTLTQTFSYTLARLFQFFDTSFENLRFLRFLCISGLSVLTLICFDFDFVFGQGARYSWCDAAF